MNSALVIGGDGLIGEALTAALKARGLRVIRTTRRRESSSRNTIHLDLADPVPNDLPATDVTFICAAMTKLSDCRKAPDLANRINYAAPLEIARLLVKRRTKTIFLSTAAVLDCEEPQMRADRARDGRSLYGKWKGMAEAAILSLGEQISVLRLTKVLTKDAILFRTWIHALRRGDTIEAFDDHRISPILVADAVYALLALGNAGGGIYQISGARDVSFLEGARYIAGAMQVSTERVTGCRARDRGIPIEETTRFTSLDCSRLTALSGFEPPDPYCILNKLFIDTTQVAEDVRPPARKANRSRQCPHARVNSNTGR